MSSATDILIEDPNAESQKQSGFLTGLARAVGSFYTKKTLGAVGLTIILLLVVVAVFAPSISRYDPSFTFQSENPNYKTNPSIADLAKNSNAGSPMIVAQLQQPDSEPVSYTHLTLPTKA